jgi:hypothetical protein
MMRAAARVVMGHLRLATVRLVGVRVSPYANNRIDCHQGNGNESDKSVEATGHGGLCQKCRLNEPDYSKPPTAVKCITIALSSR